MQQRQLRLGDILDDYCPRERRVTNHAVVAMLGPDVKQTRCSTCDTEHEYKHAKVPRQRRKSPTSAVSHATAGGPKRVVHDSALEPEAVESAAASPGAAAVVMAEPPASSDRPVPEVEAAETEDEGHSQIEDGPVHRPLIRATLPRLDGQPAPTRPAPEFTIRQPAGQGRFRPRYQQGASPFQGSRQPGNMSGGMPRHGGGRPPTMSRHAKRHGPGRNRSK